MKKILSLLAVLFGCMSVSFAQNSYVATLQHGSDVSQYYGSGALTSAYNAAVDGDVITLSPGTFTSPGNIKKGITLRGTGIDADEQTVISNDVYFYSTNSNLITTVEGIRFSYVVQVLNDASGSGQGTIKFIKDSFTSLDASSVTSFSENRGPSVRLYNVVINDRISFTTNSHPDFQFYNCFVTCPYINADSFSATSTTFVNCVIRWTNYSWSSSSAYRCHNLNFYNCIFNNTTGAQNFPSTATCFNCLAINNANLFGNIAAGANNQYVSSAEDVFKTYRTDYSAGEKFELTDAAKAAYLGTDGTQMGMQGGNYLFNTKVQYPVVTTFNSDAQTNKQGKLNIEIGVDGE